MKHEEDAEDPHPEALQEWSETTDETELRHAREAGFYSVEEWENSIGLIQ